MNRSAPASPVRLFDGILEAGWAHALEPVTAKLDAMAEFLHAERAAGRAYLPADEHVLRAFRQPFADVRAVIVGQDPFPTPGHPVGLSFAVGRDVRPLPHSLENIYRELRDDLGIETPAHGDLSAWSDQGVLLLNRCLIVVPEQPRSHHGRGWKDITDQAIRALVGRGTPLVAILFGSDAKRLRPLLGRVPSVSCGHPSPRSATRGFFGSRPFSRANALLIEQGAQPVDWSLD